MLTHRAGFDDRSAYFMAFEAFLVVMLAVAEDMSDGDEGRAFP